MNWENILTEVGYVFLKCVLVVASYKIAKDYVGYSRRKSIEKIHTLDKVFMIICAVVIAALAGLGMSALNHHSTAQSTVTNALIICVPAIIGLIMGFDKEGRLTDEQRDERNHKVRLEEFKEKR